MKDKWQSSGVKDGYYEVKHTQSGLQALFFKGELLPFQQSIIIEQNMTDVPQVTVTFTIAQYPKIHI